MDRRRAIVVLASLASLPSAEAQRSLPVIGFLSSGSPESFSSMINAFRDGLRTAGYIEGKDVTFEYRSAGNDYERFRGLADELIARNAALIFSVGGVPAALGAKSASKATPILFYINTDPVKLGLVASLSRPGGNATGFFTLGTDLLIKRLELAREMFPHAREIAMLVNPKNQATAIQIRDLRQAASAVAITLTIIAAADDLELDKAFALLVQRQKSPPLLVAPDSFFNSRRASVVALAARYGVPTIYERRDYPAVGGLVSYGADRPDAYRQLGNYAGRILKGAKPSDLPVLQPTKYELVVNLKTARALGLTISKELIFRADEVIE